MTTANIKNIVKYTFSQAYISRNGDNPEAYANLLDQVMDSFADKNIVTFSSNDKYVLYIVKNVSNSDSIGQFDGLDSPYREFVRYLFDNGKLVTAIVATVQKGSYKDPVFVWSSYGSSDGCILYAMALRVWGQIKEYIKYNVTPFGELTNGTVLPITEDYYSTEGSVFRLYDTNASASAIAYTDSTTSLDTNRTPKTLFTDAASLIDDLFASSSETSEELSDKFNDFIDTTSFHEDGSIEVSQESVNEFNSTFENNVIIGL